ncbi:unnamed protein product [Aphanomyces euteiches]|uniref:YTH domain-containing protein n=1 Tax=Aphanomyces euteiches TaxID=100861 RepID=A0A6G0XHZ5_9STRA|nr:hypothetical protein Ae201684_004655 [Aphanomyces euteiches]KAH9073255.1 hypothetical protein Ae201684P_015072 [Aphanomyces euteiches]KAH9091334.1 hypothetical protein LEN26_018746 [Aphanomyces euteiches]KAH9129267.1 hypothetical protein AeMF1_000690 [Aphanomyces euteiches]KAH9139349.1 hypothetical protein AeRB84_016372 [Aphanomyces euteiches]
MTEATKKRRPPARKHKPVALGPRFTDTRERPANQEIINDISVFDDTVLKPYLSLGTCRYFVLKSFSEANVHKSVKYGIWTSTYNNNVALDMAFKSDLSCIRPILLFFSVCGSKHFCGIARMTSPVHFDSNFVLWEKLKYEGYFHVEWLVLKDVPNHVLMQVELNQKNFTRACDGEEIPYKEATEFMNCYISYASTTSLLDDMDYYNEKQIALQAQRNLADSDDLEAFLTRAA